MSKVKVRVFVEETIETTYVIEVEEEDVSFLDDEKKYPTLSFDDEHESLWEKYIDGREDGIEHLDVVERDIMVRLVTS